MCNPREIRTRPTNLSSSSSCLKWAHSARRSRELPTNKKETPFPPKNPIKRVKRSSWISTSNLSVNLSDCNRISDTGNSDWFYVHTRRIL